jgi:hypothetical protein
VRDLHVLLLHVGAGFTICNGFKGAGCFPKGCAYVPTVEAWLRATGQWIGKAAPQPGDIAIYDWDGGVADHIGIVETYLGGGKFTAIEGNTSVGNDSDGGESCGVRGTSRRFTGSAGFGETDGLSGCPVSHSKASTNGSRPLSVTSARSSSRC